MALMDFFEEDPSEELVETPQQEDSYDYIFAKVASLSMKIMNAGGLWMELLFGV